MKVILNVLWIMRHMPTSQRWNVCWPSLLQQLPLLDRVWSLNGSLDGFHQWSTPFSQVCSNLAHCRLIFERSSFHLIQISIRSPLGCSSFIDNVFKIHHCWDQLLVIGMLFLLLSPNYFICNNRISLAYHSQTDGQYENVNKCLEGYLWCFCSERPRQWVHWLPLTQWWFSILYHPASKMSPYKATFGQLPLAISNYAPRSTTVGTVEDSLKAWTMILQI